ncbi:MAG: isomerizing glutamine--fructose-6-phosphate transaminase, partial [Bacteroidales bacterium]|nr:isomerizing glutamine--fructose-6-phosphate transaminase [Bacteroidales bacterium]
MCGIVGYIGNKQAYPILIKGLKYLEYRGYDSAGVALLNSNNELNLYKSKGKVSDLEALANGKDVSGTVGIAHTRWATHGEPCQVNAHPHCSSNGRLAIVHNGIIENYTDIKNKLQAQGYAFKSDTDTEVLVQLIQYVQEKHNLELSDAVVLALKQVIGAYAIVILDKNNPDQIIAARKSSPMVVGIGENEFIIASDASPRVEYTKNVIYIEDGEVAIIKKGEDIKIIDLDNATVNPKIQQIKLDIGQLEKDGYPHFMLKEIFDQPYCLNNCMRGRINVDNNSVALSAVIDYRDQLLNAGRFIILACGTSWHAGLIGKYLIESL